MNIKKTKFSSFCMNGIAKGCKHCVLGKKLVLFVSGKCSRNCWYCSLSRKRKNKDVIYVNERKCRKIKDLIQEIKESKSVGAGITGGDPLLSLNKTIKYAKAMKDNFRKKFHIHIYLPTKLVSKEKLRKLTEYIDEVRFHPEFLCSGKTEDIEKIKLARLFFKKQNIGIELPLLPDKKQEILDFILQAKDFIGFVNLNELELSDTNFDKMTKKYKLKQGGYVVSESKEAGLWILKNLEKRKIKLKIHLCTAELKNCSQYKNRLLLHDILPFGKRTKDGSVIYIVINKKLKLKGTYYDKDKKRTILSEKTARKLLNQANHGKHKIFRIEEFPTFDRIEIEKEEI